MSRARLLARPARRLFVAAAAASAVVALAAGASAAPAHAATFGNVFVVASASWSCGANTVTVWPMTNQPLEGRFDVWSYAQVFNRDTHTWVTTGWLLDDGIQGHAFYGMRSFDPYAKVTYARFMNGAWNYQSDWVPISADLDSLPPFCG